MAAENRNDSARPLRVVAMGGGTGLSTLLKGLKRYVKSPGEIVPPAGATLIGELSAVVTVTDDGGSSGRLRREFNILPPGDIRNCIVALSEDEALLSRLFQYRFPAGKGLAGHSFGNLFVTALTGVTGDFAQAVKLSSEVLATRGHIYPATTANVALEALMADGSRVQGETRITASTGRIVDLHMVPPDPQPLPQALEAIAQADLITIGPGSLFTSLVPNMLVKGVPQAIAASPAVKVFVCNLMTQSNESLGLSAADHVRAIYKHTANHKIFDYALLNRTPVSEALRAKYALEGAAQIVNDRDNMEQLGVRPVEGDYLDETADVARHATDRIARDLLALASGGVAPDTPHPARRERVKMAN
ncbi:MAG TPA: gluconeogenesis factor YvcK family protein [Terriglobales bacterium]|nr:gluconeogenesis factor YvcK family protein [Terriglobales bacterium]